MSEISDHVHTSRSEGPSKPPRFTYSITHLTSLQHPSDLGIWEASYDGTDWSDALRDEALAAALGGARPE